MTSNSRRSWSYCCAVRSAIKIVCARLAGSTTTSCALRGTTATAMANNAIHMRRDMTSSPSEATRYSAVRRQFEAAREVHLDAMALTNRDRRQSVQESIDRLGGCL